MVQATKRLKAVTPVVMSLLVKILMILIAYIVPFDLANTFPLHAGNYNLLEFAPEVWLSLLAFVFGTLIIVISIASEKTPKLIDLFVGEYWSRLFIWLIAFSSIENIFLHFVDTLDNEFSRNLIIVSNYVFLPCIIILAIPYIFYILMFTKSSTVIKKIFELNLKTIRAARNRSALPLIKQNHHQLFETVNQLHDLLQYIQFKEPKADIIHRLGKSLRFYIRQKNKFPEKYFNLTDSIRKDISFRTLDEKYEQIEKEKTFYEQKILRVFGTSYLLLIKDSHYDLASLCGSEIYSCGKVACGLGDQAAVVVIINHFNTILRFGINHGLKTREIRNVYNTIFHYSQLVTVFIDNGEDDRVVQCCQYFSFYANEVGKMTASEPLFIFLVETFAMELKKILMALHQRGFHRDKQLIILGMFNELNRNTHFLIDDHQWLHNRGLRLIQIALCLFYMDSQESELVEITVASILKDLKSLSRSQTANLITEDCERIGQEPEEFWEETDQGTRNIYYSPHKKELAPFQRYVLAKIEQIRVPQP